MKVRYSEAVREQLNATRRVPKGRTPQEMEQVLYEGMFMPRHMRDAIIAERERRAEQAHG